MSQAMYAQDRDRAINPVEWDLSSPFLQFIGTFTFEFFVLKFYLLGSCKLSIISSHTYLLNWDSETLLLHTLFGQRHFKMADTNQYLLNLETI